MTHPESRHLVALANAATDATVELVRRGHEAGVLRRDFTASDLCYYADVANGLALRAWWCPVRGRSGVPGADHLDEAFRTLGVSA